MVAGIIANFASAIFAGLAFVLQRYEARHTDSSGARLMLDLVKRPIWLAGLGSQIAAAALTFVAFSLAPIPIVQPFAAAMLPFLILFAWLILHETPGRQEYLGIALIAVGIVLAAVTVGRRTALTEIDTASFAVTIAILGTVIIACTIGFRVATRPAVAGVLAGIAAGTAMGVATGTFRIIGVGLSPKAGDWVPPAGLVVTALVLLVVFGAFGVVLMQIGLQSHKATSIVPAQMVTVLSTPVIVAVFGYGQALPGGTTIQALRFLAFALIIVGVVVLATSPQVQSDVVGDMPESDRDPIRT